MCRSGCPTPGEHSSWGECARAANIGVAPNLMGVGERKAWDKELVAYADARRQGIQPKGTRMNQVKAAIKHADDTGIGDPFGGS